MVTFPKAVHVWQDLGVQPIMSVPIPRQDLQLPAQPGSPSDSGVGCERSSTKLAL